MTYTGTDIVVPPGTYAGTLPTYYVAVDQDGGGYVLGATGATEAYASADWPSYAVGITAQPDGSYASGFPQGAANGGYAVTVYAQVGTTPAPGDTVVVAATTFNWFGGPLSLLSLLGSDASCFVADFGEPIPYQSIDNSGNVVATKTVTGVVTRNPAAVITQDGKTLSNDVQISILTDPILGIATVNPRRDRVTIAARYEGVATDKTVTEILNGDAGMWTLKIK